MKCPHCLAEISPAANVCMYCTRTVSSGYGNGGPGLGNLLLGIIVLGSIAACIDKVF